MYISPWLLLVIAIVFIFYFSKSSRSSKQKKGKFLLYLVISFNVEAIADWLEDGGGRYKQAGDKGEDTKWIWDDYVQKQTYNIDVIPTGEGGSVCFHREKGAFSGNGVGSDYLDNVDEGRKKYLKSRKIGGFMWDYWHGCLCLNVLHLKKPRDAKETPMILFPLSELMELFENGEFKDVVDCEEKKVDVPIVFDEKGKPKEFLKVWSRRRESSVTYSNALCSVFVAAPNAYDLIEY